MDEEALENATKERWFIISHNNVYKFYWQIFIIMLAIYNAIALPVQIAFVAVEDYYDSHTSLEVLEIMVDCFFIADMVIMFFSSFIDVTNGETIR